MTVQEDLWTPSRDGEEAQEGRSDLSQHVTSEVGAYLSSDIAPESSSLTSQMLEVEQPHSCTLC